MVKKYLLVKEEFDPTGDYGLPIRQQFRNYLSVLKKGDKINPDEFAKKYHNQFTQAKAFKTSRELVYQCFKIAKKIGILQELTEKEIGIPLSYDEFCKLDTVSYLREQLRGSRYKNPALKKDAGTASAYTYRLWNFNNWIHGKTFEFNVEVQKDKDTFQRTQQNVTLDGIEQFLKMFQKPYKVESDYVRVIKKYLLDPTHKDKRAGTIRIEFCAIKAYFEKNDSPISIKFDPETKYRTTNGEDEQYGLSLDDLMGLLTTGQPTITQKAVFLCKFHRGLDTATLVDRFNIQAWEQLVDYFGSEDYKKWDLAKCPVPIKLTRMKTDCTHIGFLDRDAIEAVQKYLDYRRKKTQREMKNGDALFLNEHRKPINNDWIRMCFRRLARNAGLDKRLDGYMCNRYKMNSHELRDLLKSTLIDSGVRYDLADHFIGHKFKDSYEKQDVLYPDTLRTEYSKASSRINIFSNFANYVKGYQNVEALKEEVEKLRKEQVDSHKSMIAILQQNGIIPS